MALIGTELCRNAFQSIGPQIEFQVVVWFDVGGVRLNERKMNVWSVWTSRSALAFQVVVLVDAVNVWFVWTARRALAFQMIVLFDLEGVVA